MQDKKLYITHDSKNEAIVEVTNYPIGIIIFCTDNMHVGLYINVSLYGGEEISLHKAIAKRMLW